MKRARTVIRDAGAKGKGVYAASRIRRSAAVASFRGKPRWIWDIPQEVWPHTMQVDYDRYVVPKRNGVIWYIYHSCEPNCVVSGNTLVADREVERGEELTFDYSTDVDWPGFKMGCSCGSRRCRKVIRAYRFLPEKLMLGYGRHVARFILWEYSPRRAARGSGPAGRGALRAAPRSP